MAMRATALELFAAWGVDFLEWITAKMRRTIGSGHHFCSESRSFVGRKFCIVDLVTVGSL